MNKEKNYKLWLNISKVLFVLTLLIHLTGYGTNSFYLIAMLMWIPGIFIFGVALVDALKLNRNIKRKVFRIENYKSVSFMIFVASIIYVVFNLIYCFSMINGISDVVTVDEVYYKITDAGKQVEIKYSEYVDYVLASFRLISGHLLSFVTAPIWYFGVRKSLNDEKNRELTKSAIKKNTVTKKNIV